MLLVWLVPPRCFSRLPLQPKLPGQAGMWMVRDEHLHD